jgi:DNA processing protein
MLIRDGAILVRSAQDILEALGQDAAPFVKSPPSAPPILAKPVANNSSLHSQILARLGPSPLAEDQLARDLNQPTSALAPALITLELDGHVLRQPGGLLSRLT